MIPNTTTPITPPGSYKIYVALITQTTTNPPTAKVLHDTIGGTWIYTYDSDGNYTLTNTGKLTLDKTAINIANVGYYTVGAGQNDINSIFIQSNDPTTSVNGVFLNTMLEIRVYN